MMFPNFNPYTFARLSPRQRMMQQLAGRGYGSFGLAEVAQVGLGSVSVLRGTSHLGFNPDAVMSQMPSGSSVEPLAVDQMAYLSPPPAPEPSGTMLVDNACTGVTCPADQQCDPGTGQCVPSRAVVEVSAFNPTPARSPFPTSVATEETAPEVSTPDVSAGPSYSPGTSVSPDDVSLYERGGNEPFVYTGGSGGSGEGSAPPAVKPATVAQQAAAVLSERPSTGIPWWGYALGAAAAGFALYKLGGRK
ncbi:MAG: hypothetical protein EPN91_08590 [Salinibacterium sp.]|nr:MAG: hypothetical protein EPN91_08590 [Salinibacterium sp.]